MNRSFHSDFSSNRGWTATVLAGRIVLSCCLLPALALSQPSLIGQSVTIQLGGLPAENVVVTDAPGPEVVIHPFSDEFIEVDINADSISLTFLDYTGHWAWVPDQSNPFTMDFTGLDFPFGDLDGISIVGYFFAGTSVTGEVLDGSSLRLYVPNDVFYQDAPQTAEIYVQLLLPLESRVGGLAYYDPNLDITWTADANINGDATWHQQVAWVADLTLAGLDGWRLPHADLDGDGVVANCTLPAACADNEMHFLGFHRGITAGTPAPFSNFSANIHWSGTDYAPNPTSAWFSDYVVGHGASAAADKSLPGAAFAVFPGDLGGLLAVDRMPTTDVWSLAVSGDGTKLLSVNIGPAITMANRGSIDILDTDTDQVAGTVSLGLGFPLDAAITHDASHAYIAVSKAFGNIVSAGQNRIEVIDLNAQTILTSIPIGGDPYGPAGVTLSPDETKLYVAHSGSRRIDIIDTASNAHTGTIPIGATVTEVAFTASGQTAYAVSREPLVVVTAIDTVSERVITDIATSLQDSRDRASVALDNGRLFGYVTSAGDSKVSMIDIDPASPNAYREVAVIPTTGRENWDSAVSADGTKLYVASAAGDSAQLIDIDSASPTFRIQTGSLALGAGAFSIGLQPVPPVAMYVAARNEEWIIPVDFSYEDYDGDTIVNRADNCTARANPAQLDTNGDGCGNICDPDFDDNGIVNFADLQILKMAFFTTPVSPDWNPDADLDGNDIVNFSDLTVMKQLFFMSPGLSGLSNACL